jgi:hypothetical protein
MIHLLRLRLFTFLIVYFLKSQEKNKALLPMSPPRGGGDNLSAVLFLLAEGVVAQLRKKIFDVDIL